jgi:Fe-S-cluster-containing dehydrogenase component
MSGAPARGATTVPASRNPDRAPSPVGATTATSRDASRTRSPFAPVKATAPDAGRARSPFAPATTAPRAAFVFDATRCTGCDACRLACAIENELPWGESWRQVWPSNPARHPAAPAFHLSMACNHCEHPRCAESCPASAYRRDEATGAVLVDGERCIGCGYCAWACPFDAPRLDARTRTMAKCTFCAPRLRDGGAPACASACPTGALTHAVLPASERVCDMEGLPGHALEPALRIVRIPQSPPDGLPAATSPVATAEHRRVDLRHEWPLLAFTWLTVALVAAALAPRFGGVPPSAPVLALGWALAFALGAVHLGRPERAWRAVLGVRTSWLSREVVLLGVHAVAAIAWRIWAPDSVVAGWAVTGLGLLALHAVDRVYDPAALLRHLSPHPAGALLGGAFLAAVLAHDAPFALAAGGARAALSLRRLIGEARSGRRVHLGLALAGLGLGAAWPWLAWDDAGSGVRWLVAGGVLAGLFADRLAFYLDLGFDSPGHGLAEALRRRIGMRAAAGAPAGAQPEVALPSNPR